MGYSATGKGLSDSDSRKRYLETGKHDVRDASGGQSQTYSHFLKTGEAGKTNFGGGVSKAGTSYSLPGGVTGSAVVTVRESGRLPILSDDAWSSIVSDTYGLDYSTSPSVSAPGTDAGVVDPVIPFFPGAYGGEDEPKTGLYLGVALVAAALYMSRRKK